MKKKSSASSRRDEPLRQSGSSSTSGSLKSANEPPIDFVDIPELESVPASAEIGKFYRPVKEQITIRLDKDILSWFRGRGGKYQRRINEALREYIRERGP